MMHFDVSPNEMISSAWRNKNLIGRMIHREVMGRYRGSILGILWSFFNPLLMLAIYTFVFSVIFKARWQTGSDSKSEFAIVLFAGLIVFGLFSECINRSPGLILSNPNFVKKIIFPLEIMPWVAFGTALFHALVSLSVLLLFSLAVNRTLPWTTVLLPLVIMPLAFFVLGMGWFLAALGVYLRDVGQVIGLVTSALMFLSPVFYSLNAIPEEFRQYLILNPLVFVIESVREVLIWERVPNLLDFFLQLMLSLVVSWLGFVWFQKTRRGFADVL